MNTEPTSRRRAASCLPHPGKAATAPRLPRKGRCATSAASTDGCALPTRRWHHLTRDLGPDELARCITYVDEAAQTTGNKNKWKDWNLVIRKCSKGRWGLERTSAPVGGTRKSASQGAAEDLRELHELFGEG